MPAADLPYHRVRNMWHVSAEVNALLYRAEEVKFGLEVQALIIRIRMTLLIPRGKLLFVTTTSPTQVYRYSKQRADEGIEYKCQVKET